MITLIKNGVVVTASDTYRADILVENEKIIALETEATVKADQVFDASGQLIFPGAIDVHTHLEMPFGGTVTADDFTSGTIAAGSDADLVIFDPEAEFAISRSSQYQNVDYTPYEGFSGKGAPQKVFSRGRLIFEDGKYTGEPGQGRFQKRKPFSKP